MRRNDIKCKYVLSPLRNSARKGLNEHSSGIEWYQSISMTTNSCMQGVMQYTSAAENASLFCKFHHEVYTRFKCFPITDKKPFSQQHHAFAVQYDAFNVNTGVVIWHEKLQILTALILIFITRHIVISDALQTTPCVSDGVYDEDWWRLR